MNKKIEKLIEWVATRFGCSAFNKPWCSLNESQQNTSVKCAKQILSHPDLALIDKEFLWKIKAVLRGIQIKQQANSVITWETEIDIYLREFDDMVIPLAEALKKIPGGKEG